MAGAMLVWTALACGPRVGPLYRASPPQRLRCRALSTADGGEGPSDGHISRYEETSAPVKLLVTSLTDVVNGVFDARAASLSPQEVEARRAAPALSPDDLVRGLRADFDNAYLFTGSITPELYDEECVFTDPTLSFKGLGTFQRNLAALGPILDTLIGERTVDLYSTTVDLDTSCVWAEWRMRGDIRLPWRPVLDLRGRTRYTFDPARKGRIVAYDEYWLDSPASQLLSLLRPAPSRPTADS